MEQGATPPTPESKPAEGITSSNPLTIMSRVSFAISVMAFVISAATFYFSTLYIRQDVVVRLTEHDVRSLGPKQPQATYSLFTFTVANLGTKPVALTHAAVGLWIPEPRQTNGFTVGQWSAVYLAQSPPPLDQFAVKPVLLMPGDIKIITTANDVAPDAMFRTTSYSAITNISGGQQIVEGLILEFETNDGRLITTAFPVMYSMKMANLESYAFHCNQGPYHALSAGIVGPKVVDYAHQAGQDDFFRRFY